MPFAPHIDPTAANIMASAGGDISRAFLNAYKAGAESRKEKEDAQKEVDHLQGQADFAHQKGYLTDEEMAQFNIGNVGKKRELATKGSMLYADDMQGKDLALKTDELQAMRGYHAAQLGLQWHDEDKKDEARTYQLTDEEVKNIKGAGYYPAMVAPGQYHLLEMDKPQLTLTADEMKQYAQAGKVPLRTAKGQVYPADIGKKLPDFDPNNPPKIKAGSKDGVMVPDGRGGWRAQFPPGAASGTVAKPLGVAEASVLGALSKRKGELERVISDHAQQIAAGDERYGLFNVYSRRTDMQEKQAELDGINAQMRAMQPAAAAAPEASPVAPVRTPTPTPSRRTPPMSSANRAAVGGGAAGDVAPLPTNDPLQSGGGASILPGAAELPAVPAGKVRVKAPDGSIGLLPVDQLERAKQQGFTQLQ